MLFGDTPAAKVTVVDYSTLRVVTPRHAAGKVAVRVVGRNGITPKATTDAYTFVGS